MTYHMSRVAHWWANGTVAFYPTNIQRQLYSSPLAEYAILQFFVLGGGSDRLANLVQWFCFGGSALAASRIASRLGADRWTQWLTAFLVLTTPIAILESTSTQNDLVCAFLTAATVYFLYCEETIWTGFSLGLAILVKSTAGLVVSPFFLLLWLRQPLQPRRIFQAAAKLAAIGSIVLALNAPLWLRNLHTFQNPLGYSPDVKAIASQALGFRPFIVNTIRDLSTELVTPSHRISRMEENGIRALCKVLRLNIDDPRNLSFGFPFSIGTLSADEDVAANPIEMALLIAATIFLLALPRLRRSQPATFAIFVWAGFLLVAWRISWQIPLARIHLPFFVLASVPVATLLREMRNRLRRTAGMLAAVLALASLYPLLHNWMRPFVSIGRSKSVFTDSRADIYFAKQRREQFCYQRTIQVLAATSCRKVGLRIRPDYDEWEYPLWALAIENGTPMVFEYLGVENSTKNAPAGRLGAPCATVAIHHPDPLAAEPARPPWIEVQSVNAHGQETATRIECEPGTCMRTQQNRQRPMDSSR